jgi:hypothetical protein
MLNANLPKRPHKLVVPSAILSVYGSHSSERYEYCRYREALTDYVIR